MLYAGDRKGAADLISNWLKKGIIVLLDRYTYSNIAYQCAKVEEELKQEELRKWILSLEFSHFAIPKPDMNIFLDVPFSFTEKKLSAFRAGDDRTYLNGSRDIHEDNLTFQRKVRDIYLKIALNDDRLFVVDCTNNFGTMLAPDKVFNLIIELIQRRHILI
jgi:dTMP kinase